MESRYEILELARFLTELSVIDYYFVTHRSSDVALAALLNSMEAATGTNDTALMGFQQELSRVAGGLDPLKKEVLECRDRLHVLYTQGGYSRPEITGRETRDETVSPVCVSFGISHLPYQQPSFPRPAASTDHVPARNQNEIENNTEGDAANKKYDTKIPSADEVHDLSKNSSPSSKQDLYEQQHHRLESDLLDMMFEIEDDA
jgi:Cyclin, C-terminal domain